MGRSIRPLEAAKDARGLLDQAILLLDSANINLPAAHSDLARHTLDQWIHAFESGPHRAKGSGDSDVVARAQS